MSDTPETEMHTPASYAIIRPDGVRTDYVPADFARKLERDRDKARRQLAAAKESLNAIHVEVGGWIAAMMKEGK
jgi:hypothetical protein